ncbi:MAG TPA: hypothetical protein VIG33_12210 [Pseudobdellovibrionaceae bacterium]|jgi:hypothetical protein
MSALKNQLRLILPKLSKEANANQDSYECTVTSKMLIFKNAPKGIDVSEPATLRLDTSSLAYEFKMYARMKQDVEVARQHDYEETPFRENLISGLLKKDGNIFKDFNDRKNYEFYITPESDKLIIDLTFFHGPSTFEGNDYQFSCEKI